MLKLRLIILRAFFDFIAPQEDKDKLNQVIENFKINPKFEYTYNNRENQTIITITRFDNRIEFQFKDLKNKTSFIREIGYKKAIKNIKSLFLMIYVLNKLEEENKKYFIK